MTRKIPGMLPFTPRNLIAALVLLVSGIFGGYFVADRQAEAPDDPAASAADGRAVAAAFAARRSDEWLEAGGIVRRTLSDDREGDQHQRFIVEVEPGLTVLVAHNIDLAPRVPLSAGDRVELRGEYEYNDKGGVIHWTHHDPRGRHAGGWIRHEGKTYR